jgi:hypothetical protein
MISAALALVLGVRGEAFAATGLMGNSSTSIGSIVIVRQQPTIASLTPDSAVAGSRTFTMTVGGSNFNSTSILRWGAVALATTYVSATKLTAAVPASLVAAAGTASITVSSSIGSSSNVAFTIYPPLPAITGLSPTLAIAGKAFTLIINGVNFTTNSTSKLGSTVLVTNYKSPTQLTAVVPAGLVSTAGTASVTVSTVSGTSPVVALTVNPPAPTITTLSPVSAVQGGASFTLTINGTNFTSAATSSWGVTPLTTTYVSATKLTAVIPASLIAAAGSASVTVSTVSGASSGASFAINLPLPTVTNLSPNSAMQGGAAFTITITGSNFQPGASATVGKWNYTPLATTYVSSTQLTVAVPASLLVYVSAVNVAIVTAGGTSSSLPFTIKPALVVLSTMSPGSVTAGFGNMALFVYGTHLTSTAVVNWQGMPMVTTMASGGAMEATVPASLLSTVGTASVTVTTVAGTSAPLTFVIAKPVPSITSISPTSVTVGGAQFTLTVNGANFLPNSLSLVRLGSAWLSSSYVSSTKMTATVPASMLAIAGTAEITVIGTGGTTSVAIPLLINPAPASITSLSPAALIAGSAGFMMTITGKAFTPDASCMWGTTALGTIYNGPTQLTIAVPANLVEFSGTASVTVVTKLGASAPATFTINPAPPRITGLVPGLATAGDAALTMTISGVSFTPAMTAKWGSSALAITYVSSTQATAAVPTSLIATAGTASILVTTTTGTSAPATFTIYPTPKITTTTLPSGTVGTGYSGPIHVTGGVPGYVWTITGLPGSFAYPTTFDNTLTITGMPTSAGAVNFQVTVRDTVGNTVGPIPYTVNIAAAGNGAENSSLNGSYACLLQGSNDTDGSRWASVMSLQADGQGHFSNGIFDTNSYDIGSGSGVVTGSYNIGSDFNGLASIHTVLTNGVAGIQTTQWGIALTSAAQPATQFRMVEADDLGTLPSLQQGTANCYLATPGAFVPSTISGNSFAFGIDGENNSSILKATVGRFSASGGVISDGVIDSALGGSGTVQTTAFTGSYTSPDAATGRFTIGLKGSSNPAGYTVYIIDASRMFILDNTNDSGEEAGNMRLQQPGSTTTASLDGSFVLYLRGAEFNSTGKTLSGFYSGLYQGGGDGLGNMTVNQSYTNDDAVYAAGKSIGGSTAFAFDPANPGRASFTSASGTTFLYMFNTTSGFEMSVMDNGSFDSGWLEPQTIAQGQTSFTSATLAGNYLFGALPLLNVMPTAIVGEYGLTANGSISGAITTASSGSLSWDQPMSTTYAWDASAPGTGSFLISNGAQRGASCIVINTTKFVCTSQSDPSPSIQIMQQ